MATTVYADFPCDRETAIALRNEIYSDEYRTVLFNISERHGYYHPSFTRNYLVVSSDSDRRNMFNILENILFFNNPIPDNNPVDHFKSRSGYVEIANDEIEGPYIRMHFDLGTKQKEIVDIIEKSFPETADLQADRFNIPKKQYRVDSSLRKKMIIDEQIRQEATDTQIALILEREGLYSEENTGDSVRMQKNRMSAEVERFNLNA
jgi:hypothetical protein